jgi:hypothetical protein
MTELVRRMGSIRIYAEEKRDGPTSPSSSSVVAQTSFGLSSAVGTSTSFSKGDHAHGTPATPIVQSTTGVSEVAFVQNGGAAVNDDSTFAGYTIAQVVKALQLTGILA